MSDGRPKTDPPTEAHDSNQLGGEEPAFYAAAAAVDALEVDLSDHAGSSSGVHGVGGSNVESEAGAQSKADSAESSAKSYTDDHEAKSNPHNITVGKIGALASSDYSPEADTHDRYSDSEAEAAADAALNTGIEATLVASGTVDTGTRIAFAASQAESDFSDAALKVGDGSSGSPTILNLTTNGDTSSQYFTAVSGTASTEVHRYAVYKLTV
jgi:hypothetical protein